MPFGKALHCKTALVIIGPIRFEGSRRLEPRRFPEPPDVPMARN
jgi:hypothetical protein